MGKYASKLARQEHKIKQEVRQQYRDLAARPPYHVPGVTSCDGCGMTPITGHVAYCPVCPSWHLCIPCMDTDTHVPGHEILMMRAEDYQHFKREIREETSVKQRARMTSSGRTTPAPRNGELKQRHPRPLDSQIKLTNSASASISAIIPVHEGVQCDLCGVNPITGVRFHCQVCPDYDLCATCSDLRQHPHLDQMQVIMWPGEVQDPQIPTAPPPVDITSRDSPVCHDDVACDVCHTQPITGPRYKCSVCPCFNMCQTCNGNDVHPPTHSLRVYERPATDNENVAEIFDDVTRLLAYEDPNLPVHHHTECRNCKVSPIRGVCFKCSQCDIKLCHGCYETNGSGHAHEMTAIVSPTQELEDELQKSMSCMRSMEKELESMKDKTVCAICMDRLKDVAFQCGHQTCLDCSKSLTSCPVCRRKISKRIRLF